MRRVSCASVLKVASSNKNSVVKALPAAAAEVISRQTQMCFVPRNLDYLRAGGRCSNATALVGNLLRLHPCIEIIDGKLDVSKVKAFKAPAGVLVECYATTLHYAPCSAKLGQGFRVLIGLPLNTNTDYRPGGGANTMDKMLWARNKWLIAHPESSEAKNGAKVGLTGVNIDLEA